jgi:hypothetical protein
VLVLVRGELVDLMHDSLQVIMDAGKRGELQNVAVQVRACDRCFRR